MAMNKTRRTAIIFSSIAVLMFGFGFALVPLYNVFCDVTGLNGKITGSSSALINNEVDRSRNITVQFIATGNENLPWDFYPVIKEIKIHPGEMSRVEYFAQNNSDKDMVVQAIPSITPGSAAKFLKKTECFCFTQQVLKKGASMRMPVLFYLDNDLDQNINTITLSYTLFDLTEKQGESHDKP